MEQFTQKLPGHLWLWLAAWQLMDGSRLGKMIWNYIEAVPSFRLDEKCHFYSFFISQWSTQFNRCPHPLKILPRNFQSQDNGSLCRQCRCHRSKSFPRTCRWSGDDLQNLRKPGSIQGNLGFAVPPATSSRKKKQLITNCRGEMMRDTRYHVIQKLSLQSGPHDYVTSLANWRPEDCMQTDAHGFNADTAVEALEKEFPYWTECSAMRQMEQFSCPRWGPHCYC